MPPRLPTIEDGRLLLPGDPEVPIAVGSPAWVAWIDAPTTRSFTFRSGQGSLTARKDRRPRGGTYWVAYRKLGGRLRNVYLGKSADVTLERLADAAALLAATNPPDPPAGPPLADTAATPPVPASALLRTKLYAPPLPQALVSRSRLVERLRAATACRLTLVVAPAGFGKTTLLGDWLRHDREARPAAVPARSAWLALDERDNDPVLFWSYVIAALQTIAPGVGAGALLILGRRSAPSPPLDQILTLVLNDLAALVDNPAAPGLALVLDDYHVITAPAIHDSLAFLLDRLPPRLRLVITSRHDPPLPLARLRVRGQLLELRAADLRFTSTEAAAFLNDVMDLSLTPADVEALEQRTEGWIAGLQLAALSMPEHADRTGFIRALSGSHRYILDYLIEEVLRQQPDEIQAFLLQTSILDRFSAELCDAVVEPAAGGEPRSAAVLDAIARANLFLTPLDDTRRAFRYHPLFAEVLQAQLQQTQPNLIPELHRRAAAWYEQQGDDAALDAALRHRLAAGEIDRAAAIVERAAELLWARGDLRTLLQRVAELPAPAVHARPWLALRYAWALGTGGSPERIPALLDAAEAALAAAPPASDAERQCLYGWIATLRSQVARVHDAFDEAIALSHEALARFPEEELRGRAAVSRGLAIAQHMCGDLRQAVITYGEAEALCDAASEAYLGATARCQHAHALHELGRLRAVAEPIRSLAARALVEDARGMVAPPAAGWALIELGIVAYARNELAQATRLLQDGVALAQRGGIRDALYIGYPALALARLAQGDSVAAQSVVDDFVRLVQATQMSSMMTAVAAVEAHIRLARGEIDAAAGWAAAYQPRPDALYYYSKFEYAVFLRVLMAEQRWNEARVWIRRQLDVAEPAGHVETAIELHALQAVAERAQGHHEAALDALDAAITLAAPESYIRVFLDAGLPMAELLGWRAARRSHDDTVAAFVRRLRAAFGTTHDAHRACDELLEPLTAREHEILRLIAAGLSTQEIAARLIVSVGTVKTHLHHLYGKLDARDRTHALVRARELGLVA